MLHDLRGYRVNGALELEAGMRLGVEDTGCPTSVQPGDPGDIPTEYYRYTLQAEVRVGGGPWTPWGTDLGVGEAQLPLPAVLMPDASGTPRQGEVRFTAQSQICGQQFRCSAPTPLYQDTYPVTVHPTASLASLIYNETTLELDDWNAWDSRVVFVQTSTLAPALQQNVSNRGFSGEGYSVANTGAVVQIDPVNPFFRIYPQPLIATNLINGFLIQGTTKTSGLRWPRATGLRGGYPFWYSADVPTVLRDRVSECSNAANSFYQYPWDNGLERRVGQGNAPPSTGSHSLPGGQEFAFDINFAEGDVVRAGRGGVVDGVVENIITNLNNLGFTEDEQDDIFAGMTVNWGNYVRIRHQDGTFAWHFHLEANGAWVDVGDVVQRGQPIAASGNTGRSGGPHLHYQVSASAGNWSQTIPISFECEVPVGGDDVTSNNWNPNFP